MTWPPATGRQPSTFTGDGRFALAAAAADPAVLGRLARIMRPGGSLRLLVSATARPGCWR